MDEAAQSELIGFFEMLKCNPHQESDYLDDVQYAGPNQVKLIGQFAVVYYVDHPVKEVKILDILEADDMD